MIQGVIVASFWMTFFRFITGVFKHKGGLHPPSAFEPHDCSHFDEMFKGKFHGQGA